jgi:hypothetical protein
VATISFKVTSEEARVIRKNAKAEQVTISQYLRKRAIGQTARRQRVLTQHLVSGLPIDAGPGAPVTQVEIDAALADYP